MSLVNRDQIRRLILKEFKMLGMADLGHGGMKPMGFSSQSHDTHNDAAYLNDLPCQEECKTPLSTLDVK